MKLTVRIPLTEISFFNKIVCCLGVLLLSSFFSCKNKCQDIDCKNGGACIDGSCNCADGYSGADCSVNVSANFLGTYNVSEACPNINAYTTNIYLDTLSIHDVSIANFFNSFSKPVTATVNYTSITVPLQDPDGNGRSVVGSGTLIPPYQLDWNYTVYDTTGTYTCTNSVWLKK